MVSDHNDVTARETDRDRERRLYEILADYFEAVEAGRVPDRADWLARHPDWADEIAAFLDEQDRQLRLIEPFRPAAGPTSPHPNRAGRIPSDRRAAARSLTGHAIREVDERCSRFGPVGDRGVGPVPRNELRPRSGTRGTSCVPVPVPRPRSGTPLVWPNRINLDVGEEMREVRGFEEVAMPTWRDAQSGQTLVWSHDKAAQRVEARKMFDGCIQLGLIPNILDEDGQPTGVVLPETIDFGVEWPDVLLAPRRLNRGEPV
jgi:hypothetical protein